MNEQAKVRAPETERSPAASEHLPTLRPSSGPRLRHVSDTERPDRFSLFPELVDDAQRAHDTIPSPPPDYDEE